MKKYLILICSLFATVAMSQDLTGCWRGTITQNEGGYRSEYRLELRITQKGDSITGKSFVFVDNIYAEMDISGNLHNGSYLELKDDIIVKHEELDGMEWCIKSYQLLLKKINGEWRLEGHWQGLTSFSNCIPGRVYLKRTVPRA